MNPQTLIELIKPGSTVYFLTPNGIGRNGTESKPAKGKAVLCFSTHVVVNMGGRYGTPAVITAENIVAAGIQGKGKIFAEQESS